MRRQLIVALLGMTLPALVQTLVMAQTPEEIAARQEAEDNYRRINARVDDMFAAIESMQKRFSALQDEIRRLNEEVARATDRSKDSTAQENLKQLAKAFEEVDRKRIADRDRMLEAFSGLENGIAALGNARPNNSGSKTTKPRVQSPKDHGRESSVPEKGYEYEVKGGDTLSSIVAALNRQGVKLSMKQVSDANPSVDWNRLQIGYKLFIPAP